MTSLTPIEINHGMTYQEATQTIICKKIYEQDLNLNQIPVEAMNGYYRNEPVHRMFIGEIIEIIEK